MKTLLYIAGSIFVLAAAAFGVYKAKPEGTIGSNRDKFVTNVRNVCGKAVNAARNLSHTERDAQQA